MAESQNHVRLTPAVFGEVASSRSSASVDPVRTSSTTKSKTDCTLQENPSLMLRSPLLFNEAFEMSPGGINEGFHNDKAQTQAQDDGHKNISSKSSSNAYDNDIEANVGAYSASVRNADYIQKILNKAKENAPTERDPAAMRGIVCEVQLHLRDIIEIKSDKGHDRYKRMRNLRGE